MAADTTAAASAACRVIEEGRESAVRLLAFLQATGADPGRQKLAEQIIRCIGNALAALRGHTAADDNDRKRRPEHGPTARRPPPGPKRRTTGSREARARSVTATTDDGFAWRKYGEKIINRHRNPRFYFRCAYRDEHGCSAKKQVQRTEHDPSLLDVTYLGDHTPACRRDAPVAVVGATIVPRPLLTSFTVGAAGGRSPAWPCSDDEALQVPSLPEGGKGLMRANMAGFTEECLQVEDELMKLVPSDVCFESRDGGLQSLDGGLDELVSLLWS